jgi:hypothetical protein
MWMRYRLSYKIFMKLLITLELFTQQIIWIENKSQWISPIIWHASNIHEKIVIVNNTMKMKKIIN